MTRVAAENPFAVHEGAAETWAFIERTNSFYPPETIDFTIAEQRAVYGRLCEAFFASYPEGVTAETTAIDNR